MHGYLEEEVPNKSFYFHTYFISRVGTKKNKAIEKDLDQVSLTEYDKRSLYKEILFPL